MEQIIRTVAVYLFLLVVVRISGKRTLGEMTAFDFILLLIISESTQQALVGDDYSVTNAALVIITFLAVDIGFSLLQMRFPALDKWIDGVPTVLVRDGKVQRKAIDKSRVDEAEIMEAARRHHGLERLEQVKHAVLEKSGGITVVPY
jgi:uncharacterized membrane protein YcaP (DUF421 family)